MVEAISFNATRSWTKTLPNATVVQAREFDFKGPFNGRNADASEDRPQAFRVEQPPGSIVEPHFHVAAEFQLIACGGGRLGRHELKPLSIHYSGAFTPYGPIVADAREGVIYYTLRPRHDPGALFLPDAKEKLQPAPKRFFMTEPEQKNLSSAVLRTWEAPNLSFLYGSEADDAAAWRATLGPNQRLTPPKPKGDGYYVVVTGGSWTFSGEKFPEWSLAFAAQGESAPELLAGEEGLDAVILQFPDNSSRVKKSISLEDQHECPLCGYVYNQAEGDPEAGVAKGTVFADVPSDWTCPNCDAPKSDFQII